MRRAAALAALALAGCGTTGSGDPQGTPAPAESVGPTVTATPSPGATRGAEPSASEYRRAADRACARARRDGERALARVADLRPDDPQAFQRLAVAWDGLTEVHERWLAALRALDRPSSAVAAALEENVTERLVLTRRIEAAFSRHDGETGTVLLRDLYRLQQRGAALRADHGFADCGSGTPGTIAG